VSRWDALFTHNCQFPRRKWRRKPWTCPVCRRRYEPFSDTGWSWETEAAVGVIENVTFRYPDGRTKTFPNDGPEVRP
jgi:hypothetical protein